MTTGRAFLALIALLPFILAACSDASSTTDPRTQALLVRVGVVERSAQTERSFTGTVAARVESDLGFRVPGNCEMWRLAFATIACCASLPR